MSRIVAPALRGRRARWLLFTLLILGAILIPFGIFGSALDTWSIAALDASASRGASFGLIVGLLALDVFLPVPSSLISTAAGAVLGMPLGALASFIGMTTGCLLGYRAGRTAGRWLSSGATQSSEEQGPATGVGGRPALWLALTRAVPVLAEASVITAGAAAMPLRSFLAVTALSNLAISATYGVVGAYAARMDSFILAFGGAIALPLLGMWAARAFDIARQRRTA